MVNQKLITRDESVVCLITGNGLKDTEGVSASLRELNVVDINEDLS
jgi:threonine synthase